MKNIKDIILSIFAIIGFVVLLSSFTNQPESEVSKGTPESHVWESAVRYESTNIQELYLYNRVTGEVRVILTQSYYNVLKRSTN